MDWQGKDGRDTCSHVSCHLTIYSTISVCFTLQEDICMQSKQVKKKEVDRKFHKDMIHFTQKKDSSGIWLLDLDTTDSSLFTLVNNLNISIDRILV